MPSHPTATHALVATLPVTGCSRPSGDTEVALTAKAATPAPSATEPAVDETSEAPPVPTEVGATVPADQFDAAHEAGRRLRLPHGDGNGSSSSPAPRPRSTWRTSRWRASLHRADPVRRRHCSARSAVTSGAAT